jgi:FKBP-type peptidyl-prolyl cis-trans isomerase 2
MKKSILILMCGILLGWVLPTNGDAKMIEQGSQVSIDYTLTVDGNVVDTSEGKQPLEYTQGQGQIIPGLEKALEGLEEEVTTKVTVAPEDAYGARNQELVTEVTKDKLGEDIDPQVGMVLQLQDAQGQPMPGTITVVKDDTIILDFNHPLAGKELTFDVTVVSVK